jgi:prepilin-type N-terminal cleavage/methylation domain-containing protein
MNELPMTSSRKCNGGFTLVEMAIVLLIVTLLLGGLLMPLSAQVEQRKIGETQKTLDEANEALFGYAMANNHLPCPDKTSGAANGASDTPNDGIEDFDAVTGQCITQEGNFPWVTMGVGNQDAWGQRFLYRVTEVFSDRVPSATFFTLNSTGTIRICATATCSAPRLSDNAVAVLVSRGKNQGNCAAGASPPNCADEYENIDGDNNFVSRVMTEAGAQAGEFDDIVVWLSPNILFNRMVAAGKLP